uniref:alginate lyase family protein n=1 Tax=Cupriavidus necator TaxID=106590 RepID=UPI003F490AF1
MTPNRDTLVRRYARRLLVACTIALSMSGPAAHASTVEGTLLIGDAEIQDLKAHGEKVQILVARCEAELDYLPSPVAEYSPAAHYSSQGAVHNSISQRFANDGTVAYRAGLCYLLTHDDKFSHHVRDIVIAWSSTVKSVTGDQARAEFNFYFPQYIIAASMVRAESTWNDAEFRRFLKEMVTPLSNSFRSNNHANWGVLLETSVGAYLGDKVVLSHAAQRWQALMQNQIAADGSLPLEICRSDTTDWCGGVHKGINGLSYTHWTLLPAALTARLFELQGIDVWGTPGGAKLASAFSLASAWTCRPDTFPFYGANDGKLNGVRNAAYFALLRRHYPNSDAEKVLNEGNLGLDRYELGLIFG